jgi:hypothetical protein
MHAWQIAKRSFEGPRDAGAFERLLGQCLAQGAHVVSFPDIFVIAYPVRWTKGNMIHSIRNGDTWFVHLAAVTDRSPRRWATVERFMELAPYPLPFIAWQRETSARPRTTLRRIRWQDVERHLNPSSHYVHQS